MKVFLRYLFALWTAFAVYFVLTFAFGANSPQVQRHLESEIERLAENVEVLESINTRFRNTVAALEYDGEALAAQVRQLGYGRPGERHVRVVGLRNEVNVDFSPGQVLTPVSPDFLPNETIIRIAFFSGLTFFLIFLAVDIISLGIFRRD